jgi:ABC-type multidrug transport system ATPase subunit
VLANRKTGGHIDGKILINGKPRDRYFNRFTGYIEQQDILMPFATVRETLSFSAENRLPRATTRDERQKEGKKHQNKRVAKYNNQMDPSPIQISVHVLILY